MLQNREVAVELPLGHLYAVVLPLLPLDLHIAVEDVLAEGAQHEIDMRYADALKMADDCMTYRITVKEYAM